MFRGHDYDPLEFDMKKTMKSSVLILIRVDYDA